MVSRFSVRLLASVGLIDFANEQFAGLMNHRDHREDAFQELRMVDAFLPQETGAQKRRVARQALTWLAYDLGVTTTKPRCKRPAYEALPVLEEGTLLNDLSLQLEALYSYERAA